ncbi:MAG: hypothetical protein JNM66_08590 [Bryobacterales bacterium]|nr:hypothetical protein [Bryobacterales bacterium]
MICHLGGRHHGLVCSFPVASLAALMGSPARLSLLIALVRRASLLPASIRAASRTTVSLAAITATADMENGPARRIVALLLTECLVNAGRRGLRHSGIMPSVRGKPKLMIGPMTGAFGADDAAASGATIRKLRFQMIADRYSSSSRSSTICFVKTEVSISSTCLDYTPLADRSSVAVPIFLHRATLWGVPGPQPIADQFEVFRL